eukprot:15361187-Ditylum_brightwellii.AAC.1
MDMYRVKKLEIEMHKLLTKHGFHNLKANAHQLYLHSTEEGRGFTQIENIYGNECSVLAKYILKNTD